MSRKRTPQFSPGTKSSFCSRHSTPDLIDGRIDRVDFVFDKDKQWLRLTRGSITLASNLAEEPAQIPMPYPSELVMSSTSDVQISAEAVCVGAEAAVVLRSMA